jgi:hypothetical protein
MCTFTRSLTKALDKLREVGGITAYWISKPKRGSSSDRRLVVWKKGEASPTAPIPNERGLYVSPSLGKNVTKENGPMPYVDVTLPSLPY